MKTSVFHSSSERLSYCKHTYFTLYSTQKQILTTDLCFWLRLLNRRPPPDGQRTSGEADPVLWRRNTIQLLYCTMRTWGLIPKDIIRYQRSNQLEWKKVNLNFHVRYKKTDQKLDSFSYYTFLFERYSHLELKMCWPTFFSYFLTVLVLEVVYINPLGFSKD